MEFLAFLYTVLLVAICLMMALLLYRSAKPTASRDDTELKEWLRQQLDAQNRQMEAKLAEMSQQNLAAMGHISETLQASVQSMSTALAAGQGTHCTSSFLSLCYHTNKKTSTYYLILIISPKESP